MAQVVVNADDKTRHSNMDQDGNVIFAVRSIGSGASAFAVLVLCQANTSYYMWVDTTGDLRIGPTEPTAATVDSAGAIVGGQS